jgi:xanthine dehydrogenase accessory factor
MPKQAPFPRPVTIVLGCGEVGSAVALALHQSGLAVVLADEADPAWHRRGMAFTNAWYVGNAELESEGTCFCASLKSIPSILGRGMIAGTTWSWPGVAAALDASVLVDARGRKRRGSEVLRGRLSVTIGIGPGFANGENVDVAIEIPAEKPSGSGGRGGGCPHSADGGNAADDGCISSYAVEASRHGRFMTERRIGDSVRVGQIVGGLGNEAVKAPADGVLLGLAARGARIEPGDTLVEVDPEGVAHRCYGVGAGPRRLAASVLAELAAHGGGPRGRPLRTDALAGAPVTP